MNCHATNFEWNDGRVADLTSLWAEGKSASEIAQHFGDGLTRSAVLGKVHRLRLPKRRDASSRRAVRESPSSPVADDEVSDVTHLCGLLDLTDRTCKFPIGDPLQPGFGFCGKPKEPDAGAYCPVHTQATHRRGVK